MSNRWDVLWENLGKDGYCHSHGNIHAAMKEAIDLHNSPVPWQKIRIYDVKNKVLWVLRDQFKENLKK